MPSAKLTALAVLLALSGSTEAKMTKRKLEFLKAMKESEKVHGPIRMAKPSLADFLRKSEQVSLKGSASSSSSASSSRVSKEDLERRLDYYASFEAAFANEDSNRLLEDADSQDDDPAYKGDRYNNNYNKNYNNYNGNDQSTQSHWYDMFTKYFQGQNGNETAWDMYNDDGNDVNANRTYDLSGLADLSIKYAGCSSTTSYTANTDGEDDDQSSHFIAETLVQYRLCPAESCNDNSWRGCKSEYGEYMMKLEDFLETQSELRETEVQMLCKYCQKCEEFNDSGYCNGGNCCSHSGDCNDNSDVCKGGNQDDEAPDYEDLFDCMEVDVSEYRVRRRLGNDGNDDDEENSAYVGVHCNGLHIELGLFEDSSCTKLIGGEDTIDIQNITGIDFSTEELEDYYVPDGCLACGGEEYNVSTWYHHTI